MNELEFMRLYFLLVSFDFLSLLALPNLLSGDKKVFVSGGSYSKLELFSCEPSGLSIGVGSTSF